MKLFLVLTLLFHCLISLSAQEMNLKEYQENSIYLQERFLGRKYVKEGKFYPMGIMGKTLKQELRISPNALVELKKYRTNRLIAVGLGIAGGALLFASTPANRYSTSLYGSQWIGLGGILAGSLFEMNSRNKLHKSIWLYNQDILR